METDSINYDLAEYKYHFDYSTCEQIIIEHFKYATDKNPKRKLIVSDKQLMNNFFEMLKDFPKEGDMYVSFSEKIEYMQVCFICEGKQVYRMEFYGGRIKTEGTSFVADDINEAKEKTMYNLLLQILSSKN